MRKPRPRPPLPAGIEPPARRVRIGVPSSVLERLVSDDSADIYGLWSRIKQDQKLSGAIIDIKLVNVRSHENFALVFHPGITVLTGANGSGKSSIIIAIMLALGASPHHAWPQATFSKLFRQGSSRMSVELTLWVSAADARRVFTPGSANPSAPQYDTNDDTPRRLRIVRTWRATGTSTGADTVYIVDVADPRIHRVGTAPVTQVCEALFLQPRQPTCVLTQQRAKQFLHDSSPADMNRFVNDGICVTSIIDAHATSHRNYDAAVRERDERERPLTALKNEVATWRRRLDAVTACDALEASMRTVARRQRWLALEAERVAAVAAVAAASETAEAFEARQAELMELRSRASAKEDEMRAAQAAAEAAQGAHEAAQVAVAASQQPLRALAERTRRREREIEAARDAAARARERVRLLQRQLRDAEAAVERRHAAAVTAAAAQRARRAQLREEARARVQSVHKVEPLQAAVVAAAAAVEDAQRAERAAESAHADARGALAAARDAAGSAMGVRDAQRDALRRATTQLRAAQQTAARTARGATAPQAVTRLDALRDVADGDKLPALIALLHSDATSGNPQYRFTRPPIGPLGCLLSARPGTDPHLVTYVENVCCLPMMRVLGRWFVADIADVATLARAGAAVGIAERTFRSQIAKVPFLTDMAYAARGPSGDPRVQFLIDLVEVTPDDVSRRWPASPPTWATVVRSTILTQLSERAFAWHQQGATFERFNSATGREPMLALGREARVKLDVQLLVRAPGDAVSTGLRLTAQQGVFSDYDPAVKVLQPVGNLRWHPSAPAPPTAPSICIDDLVAAERAAHAALEDASAAHRDASQRFSDAEAAERAAARALEAAAGGTSAARRVYTTANNALRAAQTSLSLDLATVGADDDDDDGDVPPLDVQGDPTVSEKARLVRDAGDTLRDAAELLAQREAVAVVTEDPEAEAAAAAAARGYQAAEEALQAAHDALQRLQGDLSRLRRRETRVAESVSNGERAVADANGQAAAAMAAVRSLLPQNSAGRDVTDDDIISNGPVVDAAAGLGDVRAEEVVSRNPSTYSEAAASAEAEHQLLRQRLTAATRGKDAFPSDEIRAQHADCAQRLVDMTVGFEEQDRILGGFRDALAGRKAALAQCLAMWRHRLVDDFVATLRSRQPNPIMGAISWHKSNGGVCTGCSGGQFELEPAFSGDPTFDHMTVIAQPQGGAAFTSLRNLSGGEGSFTTAALLAAVYGLAPSPVRVRPLHARSA